MTQISLSLLGFALYLLQTSSPYCLRLARGGYHTRRNHVLPFVLQSRMMYLSCFVNNCLNLCSGQIVLAVTDPDGYFKFLDLRSLCFVASLSVLHFLLSGCRLKNKFFCFYQLGCAYIRNLFSIYFAIFLRTKLVRNTNMSL